MFTLIQAEPNHLDDLALLFDAYRVFYKKESDLSAAQLYFIINVFKLPFHVFVWETVQLESLKISLLLAPFVALGLYVGVKLVREIKENAYRKLILLFTAIGALVIIFQ